MMPKAILAGFVLAAVLSCSLTGCQDTQTLQENAQLKTKVLELQKQNGQLGNDLETMTTARNALTKENETLRAQIEKTKRPQTRAASRKPAKGRKARQS
jgi:outer membrane murein-binding lipoprotein Lpp